MSAAFMAMLAAIGLTCVGQLLMKAANQTGAKRYPLGGLLHPLMVAGLGVMFGVTLLASYALGQVSLGTFTAWNATVYPLTVLSAAAVFKERLGWRVLLGVACVCMGVVVFSL